MTGSRYKILIDLGIGGLSAGVLENYNLIKVEKMVVPLPEKLSLKEIFRKTKNPLFELIEELLKSFRKSEILFGLDAPFYGAETRIIKIKRKPFVIDKKFLDNLLKEEINALKHDASVHQKIKEEDFEPIEKEIMQSFLNGYSVTVNRIFDKKITEAELALYLSIGPRKILNEIREEIEKTQADSTVSFHTLPFIMYKNLTNKQNAIILHLGKEISEILLIEEGYIKEIVSFAKGSNFFARRLASYLNISIEEGAERLVNYLQDQLNPQYFEKIKGSIEAAFQEFGQDLQKSILMLSKEYFFPSQVLLIAPPYFFNQIKDILSQEMFKNYTILKRHFEVKLFQLDDFNHLFNIEGSAKAKMKNNPELAFLTAYSILKNGK